MELQFITHYTDRYTYFDSARMALEGGCRWIQLRMKDASPEEVEREALRVQDLCRQYGATFIIDDHVELVEKLHADGVHLGKKDMPIAEARRILGPDFIIGGTFHHRRYSKYFRGRADTLRSGSRLHRVRTVPIYHNKEKPKPGIGAGRLSGHRFTHERSGHQPAHPGINLPIVAIGGITFEDIPAIMQTGVSGIALSGSILRADDPIEETKRIVES